jgi:glycosyltransferase involved in cell wall biosynthesis
MNKPLRVAHVLNELRPSGAESMLVTAAPLWAAMGISCDAIATGASLGPYAQQMRDVGFAVHHVPVGKSPVDLLRFRRFLCSQEYDVVHLHPEGRGYWLALMAMLAGALVVRTIHSNFPFEGLLRLRRKWQRWHMRIAGVKFIAIAPGVQENERIRFDNACDLIWNWLDISRFGSVSMEERESTRHAMKIPHDRKVLVSVGNCSNVKNHAIVFSALAKLAGGPKFLYLHVGMEDAGATERLLAEALGISDQVKFMGWTRDVRGVLVAADLFVMPSLFEGFSIAVLEALALGMPVLLADTPGLRDLRPDFPSIRYCEPSAGSLADALLEFLVGDTATRESLNEQVKTCRRIFDPRRGAEQYAQIYRGMERQKKAPR